MTKYNIIQEVTQQEASDFFFSDPKLALLGLSDEEMACMLRDGFYKLHDGSTYFKVIDSSGAILSIVKYEWFTTHCINFHMYIKSELHHTIAVKEITDLIAQYGRDHPKMMKAIIMVPSSCGQVHTFAPKYGWKQEGRIKKCYKWREQIVDIVIYGLDLTK